jgi:hypothetical protein
LHAKGRDRLGGPIGLAVINVVRRMLGRTWIDPVRCERGLEALIVANMMSA